MTSRRAVAVFVHGLSSSPEDPWEKTRPLLAGDPDLADVRQLYFTYGTPYDQPHPYRRAPDVNDVGGAQLRTFLDVNVDPPQEDLVLVTHGKGGLVALRYLAEASRRRQADTLIHLKRVVMLACPTAGSSIDLNVRRRVRARQLWNHLQKRADKPLDAKMKAAEQVVLTNFVFATEVTKRTCPVVISTYSDASDNIASRASAHSPFTNPTALPGGQDQIMRPSSQSHTSYLALKKQLLEVMYNSADAK